LKELNSFGCVATDADPMLVGNAEANAASSLTVVTSLLIELHGLPRVAPDACPSLVGKTRKVQPRISPSSQAF